MSNEQLKTVKIETMDCSGTASSATCPYCGKIKFLSHELNTLQAFCDKCYSVFNLE